MKQLVSILIPAFNAEKWISDCIESALAQKWPWKEVVVIDDGSRDSTCKIAKSYASKNVYVGTQENRGASAARNRALSIAQGDYIQWLDADDLLESNKIAKQLVNAEPGDGSRILISGEWGRFYNRPEMARFEPNLLWKNLSPTEWLYRKMNNNLWMPPAAFLVSRKLTEITELWNEEMSLDDDGEYFCRIINNSSAIHFISDARCFKRFTFGLSHNLTLSNTKLDSLAFSLFSYIKTLMSLEYSYRTQTACLRFLNRWAIYFYPERPDIIKKMRMVAREIDGELTTPKLKFKYQIVKIIFGWNLAKKAQYIVPAIRSVVEKKFESLLFKLSGRQKVI